MATSAGQDGTANSSSDVDNLLHPELLSEGFLKLILKEREVKIPACLSRDELTELYLRHVMPLPQRPLPSSRWGRSVSRDRDSHLPPSVVRNSDSNRKRPLITFDGSSSNSGPLKVRKPEGGGVPSGSTDRLKPPPGASMASPIRKITTVKQPASTEKANFTQETHHSNLDSPTAKKKIQHVTWP